MGPGSVVRAMALMFLSWSQRPWLRPLTGVAWLDSHPAAATGDSTAAAELLGELTEYARGLRVVSMSVGSYACGHSDLDLVPLGFASTERIEFELSLQRDENELYGAMDKIRRQKIRKAEREGVVITELQGADGVAELRRLQAASANAFYAGEGLRSREQREPRATQY